MFRVRKTDEGQCKRIDCPFLNTAVLRYIAFTLTLAVATTVFADNNPSANYFEDPTNYPGTWPADNSWVPYTSGGNVIVDLTAGDTTTGGTNPSQASDVAACSLAGNTGSVFFMRDSNNLYLRMCLDTNPYSSTARPFVNVTWSVLIDTDGDGFREYVLMIDGNGNSAGDDAPDNIYVLYKNDNRQDFSAGDITIGNGASAAPNPDFVLWAQDSAGPGEAPAAGVDGETISYASFSSPLDQGRTRIVEDSVNGNFFLDVQAPLVAFDASLLGGSTLDISSPIAFAYATANSNSNPVQKDFAAAGDFTVDASTIIPFGDTTSGGEIFDAPLIPTVSATSCNTTTLSATVNDSIMWNPTSSAFEPTITGVDFLYQFDSDANGQPDLSGSWVSIGAASLAGTTNPWTRVWNSTSLPPGTYFIKARATDSQTTPNIVDSTDTDNLSSTYNLAVDTENSGSAIFATFNNSCGTTDTSPPVVTVSVLTTSDSTPALSGSVDDATATITVSVGGNSYSATNNGDGSWSLADNSISPALGDGTYNIVATATDTAGNVGTDGSTNELTVDATAPTITVTALSTTDTTPALSGTVNDATATIAVSVGGNSYTATNNGDGSWSLPDNSISPALGDGTYNIVATATDTAGNAGTDGSTNELTVDATAPTITVTALSTTDTTPALSGTINDATATIAVSVGGNSYTATNNGDGSWSLADNSISPALGDGTYNIVATATDTAGNAGTDITINELVITTDSDADADGLSDAIEATLGTDPNDADTDDDGLSDGTETGGDNTVDAGDTNPLDADTDNDGISDGDEVNGSGPLISYAATNPLDDDSDGDGIKDGVEVGVTAGIPGGNSDDNATPYAGSGAGFIGDASVTTTTDPNNVDSDGDGLNDGVEDANQDGATLNSLGGTGTSGVGETNPTIADTDGDGLNDGDETNATGPLATIGATDPLDTDTDDGGVDDGTEVLTNTTNPTVGGDDIATDSDADGLTNSQEALLGTDPNNPDSDSDGIPDGVETGGDASVDPGETHPLRADTDDDGLADGTEDANRNGIIDLGETNPTNADSDGDGIGDGIESGVATGVADPDGTGPASGTSPGFVGDADITTTTNPLDVDSDGDGLTDGIEDSNANGSADNPVIGGTNTNGAGETDAANSDTDGDGLSDGEEVNGNGDLALYGATDPLDTDTDDGGAQDGAEVRATIPTNPTLGNGGDDPIDTDGDGVFDGVETTLGTDPNDADTDNDGLLDGQEAGNDGIIGPNETDPLDADTDNDGIADGAEDTNANGTVDSGETDPLIADTDGDGIGDGVEIGAPTPGIPGGVSDNANIAYSGTAAGFIGDADPDTTTDPNSLDTDNDGIDDGVEDVNRDGAATNTIGDSNSDGTGETDATNPDTDGDGLSDGEEINGIGPLLGIGMTNPLDSDTDNGGTEDGTEVFVDGTDPTPTNDADDAGADPDADGLSNAQEAVLGTDPNAADSDNDGIDDGDEVKHDAVLDADDTNPLDADSDDDGLTDGNEILGVDGLAASGDETLPLQADTDGDGLFDGLEIGVTAPVSGGISTGGGAVYAGTDVGAGNYAADTDPATTTSATNPDSDSDGLTDGVEDANGDGATVNTIGATGSTGNGETNPNIADTDGDGLADGIETAGFGPLSAVGATSALDTDTDDGGSEDGVEVLADGTNPTTGNGSDDLAADPDGDGLSNAQEMITGTDPNDADTDNDGIGDGLELGGDTVQQPGDTDPLDADSDDDGIADGAETVGADGLPNTLDETNPNNADSDLDGLYDGTEIGTITPILSGTSDAAAIPFAGTDLGANRYIADQDTGSTTNPADADSDNDGLADGFEDANANGARDSAGVLGGTGTSPAPGDETDPNNADSDGDGLLDGNEINATGPLAGIGTTDPLDLDTDDGGVNDGDELNDMTNPSAGNAIDDFVDSDGDGIVDASDSAPTDPCEPSNLVSACDSDGDGISDGDELNQGSDPNASDSDGDGLLDGEETADTDGDGIPDSAEIDSDNDGVPDIVELMGDPISPPDSDNDGIPDYRDTDSDNDGISDADEYLGSATLTGSDQDGDGIDDAIDVDLTGGEDNNGDGIDDNLSSIDTDADGIPDALDPDSDNDGLPDVIESSQDTDLDGVPDYRDLDSDGDGIGDALESGRTEIDSDGDGIEDRFDIDQTGGPDANQDGIDDNAAAIDSDADGVPDHLDLDSDNDSLTDVLENGGTDLNGDGLEDTSNVNLVAEDTDNDGIPNFRDLQSDGTGTFDIVNGDAELDGNGDGVIDALSDTDGDGLPDVSDASPNSFGANTDPDGDGISAAADLDSDNDGIPDAVEAPDGDFLFDTDLDGVPDYLDLDSDNDGIPDVLEGMYRQTDVDGDGLVDNFIDADSNGIKDSISPITQPKDTDRDGTPDFRDLDADGDGLSDMLEVGLSALDGDADQRIDADLDTDLDGWFDVADTQINGQPGAAGAQLMDNDNDGTPNYLDLDSDGDGFNDDIENGDFDKDGIMDYLQNDQARLETATRGSGGSMGWEAIPVVLLFGWIAWRQRRRSLANVSCVAMASVLLTGVFASQPVFADTQCKRQTYGDSQLFQRCFYVQAGFVGTHVDPENTVDGWHSTDDDDQGWKVGIGWHFKPRWFLELSYADLGAAGLSHVNPAIEALVPNAEIEYTVPALMTGFWLRSPEARWNGYFKAGAGSIRNKYSDRRIDYEKQTNVQIVFGAGFQYRPDDSSWFVRAEFDSYDRDAWAYGLSVGRHLEPRD